MFWRCLLTSGRWHSRVGAWPKAKNRPNQFSLVFYSLLNCKTAIAARYWSLQKMAGNVPDDQDADGCRAKAKGVDDAPANVRFDSIHSFHSSLLITMLTCCY